MTDETQIILVQDDGKVFTITEAAESVVFSSEESSTVISTIENEIIVDHREIENVVLEQSEKTEILTEGEQGPPGPQGVRGEQGIIGPLGPVGAQWRGPWSSTDIYKKNDIVQYYGSSYIYINDISSSGQPVSNNSSHWQVFSQRGEDGSAGSSANDVAVSTGDPSGFEKRNDSSFFIDAIQRRFYIQPAVSGGSYTIWISGQKIVKHVQENAVFPSFSGTYHAYFDTDSTLKISTITQPIHGCASISIFYWDESLQKSSMIFEERHGISMSFMVRKYIHDVMKTQWSSGFNLIYNMNGDGSTDDEMRITLSNGVVHDEDNEVAVTHSSTPSSEFEQILSPFSKLPIVHCESGVWKILNASQYPLMILNHSAYNQNRESLVDVEDGKVFSISIFVTTNIQFPIISIPCSRTHESLSESINYDEVIDGLPSSEFKKIYSIHYRCSSSYLNSFKAKMLMISDHRENHRAVNVSTIDDGLKIDSAGDKQFIFTQEDENDVWIIDHGMNKYPSIEVIDSSGSNVEGDIEFSSINSAELRFSIPISGKAFLN
jgi:hypothetical protein